MTKQDLRSIAAEAVATHPITIIAPKRRMSDIRSAAASKRNAEYLETRMGGRS